MEAVGDVSSLLAAENEHRAERLALDRPDQVLHDPGVLERCRRQPRGPQDVVCSAFGERGMFEAFDGLGDVFFTELEREVCLGRGVIVLCNVGGPFDADGRVGHRVAFGCGSHRRISEGFRLPLTDCLRHTGRSRGVSATAAAGLGDLAGQRANYPQVSRTSRWTRRSRCSWTAAYDTNGACCQDFRMTIPNVYKAEFDYDPEDPPGYRSGSAKVGRAAGAGGEKLATIGFDEIDMKAGADG